jgi:hypothetical protein
MNCKLCEGVTIENVDGHNILITEKGDVAVLNETAAYILDRLLDADDLENAIQTLTGTYDAEDDTVRADAETFIAGLRERGLLQSSAE